MQTDSVKTSITDMFCIKKLVRRLITTVVSAAGEDQDLRVIVNRCDKQINSSVTNLQVQRDLIFCSAVRMM